MLNGLPISTKPNWTPSNDVHRNTDLLPAEGWGKAPAVVLEARLWRDGGGRGLVVRRCTT
jgi:hypothetical protein